MNVLKLLFIPVILFSVSVFAGMKPFTTVVLIDERKGGDMLVINDGKKEAMLTVKVNKIEQDNEDILIYSPSISLVSGGDQQLVRFFLKNDVVLKTQRLRRAIFTSLPKTKKNESTVGFGVGHNLPVIINPHGLAKNEEPWKMLKISEKEDGMYLLNDSPYIVRLHTEVDIISKNSIVKANLKDSYILAFELVKLLTKETIANSSVSSVEIQPVSLYGFSSGEFIVSDFLKSSE